MCYWPDGSVADGLYACGLADNVRPNGARQCCGIGDMCTTNGLCKSPAGYNAIESTYRRMACTDKSWESNACPKYCYNKFIDPKDDSASRESRHILACEDLPSGKTKYCCLYPGPVDLAKNPYICCNDSTRTFAAASAAYFAGAQIMTSWPVNPVAPTLTGTSTTAATTTPTATRLPTGLSTGAKAGIGVGTAGAAILLLALVILFFKARSRRKWAAHTTALDPNTQRTGLFDFSEEKMSLNDRALPASPATYNPPASGRQCSSSFEIHTEESRAELPTNESA